MEGKQFMSDFVNHINLCILSHIENGMTRVLNGLFLELLKDGNSCNGLLQDVSKKSKVSLMISN